MMGRFPACKCGATLNLYFSKRLDRHVCPECQEQQIEILANPKKYPLEAGKDDGGPAFPTEQGHIPDGTWNQTYVPGMSLRAYFAGQAFKALTLAWAMPHPEVEEDTILGFIPTVAHWNTIATAACEGADAMLAKLRD